MYKNQLQELAQRSCFNLPSYACIREGPDHAPRFKASVNFNGEIFESSNYCTTLRQAEHAAAEVALNVLSTRGLSRSLTARVLDETGVYKNLLQETAHRAGLKLPVYTTVRSGPGHVPVFTCTVELAGMNFTGDSAKTKKQAEKNAAIAAWSSLKTMPNLVALSRTIGNNGEEQDKIAVAGVVSNFGAKDETKSLRMRRDQNQNQGAKKRPQKRLLDLLVDSSSNSTQKQSNFFSILPPPPPRTTSKILPPTISSSLNNHHHNMQNEDDEKDEEWRNGPKPLYRPIDKAHLKNVPQICRPVYTGGDDDEEWLNGANPLCRPISKAGSQMGRTVYTRDDDEERRHGPYPLYKPISKPNDKAHMKIPSQMGRLAHNGDDDDEEEWLNGPSPLYRPIDKTHMKPGFQMGQAVYTGGYHYPKAFAPAVNIRSIIPVCAAPPLPVRPHTSNPPLVKEDESGLISMFNKVRL